MQNDLNAAELLRLSQEVAAAQAAYSAQEAIAHYVEGIEAAWTRLVGAKRALIAYMIDRHAEIAERLVELERACLEKDKALSWLRQEIRISAPGFRDTYWAKKVLGFTEEASAIVPPIQYPTGSP